MLPPRRHRHRTESCPACERSLGNVKPSSSGGLYLVVDQVTSVEWDAPLNTWIVRCRCGCLVRWTGDEIKWLHPERQAA